MGQKFPFEHFFKNNSKSGNISQALVNLTRKTSNDQEDNREFRPKDIPPSVEKIAENLPSDELKEINLEILGILRKSINEQKFKTYFERNFTITGLDAEKIEFSVSTIFIKNMIVGHYIDHLKEAIMSVLGNSYEIIVSVKKTPADLSSNHHNILNSINKSKHIDGDVSDNVDFRSPNPLPFYNNNDNGPRNNNSKFNFNFTPSTSDLRDRAESRYIEHMNPSQAGITIDKNKTFDCFIVGPSNGLACASAKAVAQNPGKTGKYPSLYFHGDSGLGKTHLLHAIANEIRIHYPSHTILFTTAREFMKEMIDSIQINKLSEFQLKYTDNIDVLMIDDIHELSNKKATQDEFFHIFNALYNKGKQLVFTSDKSPKEINGLAERIKTRLQWGLVVDIQIPDLETRIAILKKMANSLDLYIPDEVINLIASSIQSSIRALEGALIKLSAAHDTMRTEIDIDMVKELLKIKVSGNSEEISLENICKEVAQYFRIPLVDLKSAARTKELTTVRHLAMYLSRHMIGASYAEIGDFYGGRDHSSILHGVNKITDQMKANESLYKDMTTIRGNLSKKYLD